MPSKYAVTAASSSIAQPYTYSTTTAGLNAATELLLRRHCWTTIIISIFQNSMRVLIHPCWTMLPTFFKVILVNESRNLNNHHFRLISISRLMIVQWRVTQNLFMEEDEEWDRQKLPIGKSPIFNRLCIVRICEFYNITHNFALSVTVTLHIVPERERSFSSRSSKPRRVDCGTKKSIYCNW